MDQQPDDGAGNPERKHTGIVKYLKRIRSAIKPSNPHKGVKQTDADEAGPSAGRHLESAASFVTNYTYRTKTPEHRNRTPEHRNRTPEFRNRTPDLAIRTKTPSVGRRTPSLRTTTPDVPRISEEVPPLPNSRPPLPEPSVSVGSLLARPLRDLSSKTRESLTRSPDAVLERSSSSLLPRSDPRDERSIALFERYGIHLEPGDWAPANRPATMERVDKEIRMRVHHHCHRCEVALGPSKICINCGHKKCKKCPRFPVRKHKHRRRHAHDDGEHDGDGWEDCPSQGGSREMSERDERSPLLAPRERQVRSASTVPLDEGVEDEKEIGLSANTGYEGVYDDPGGEIGLAISTSPGVKAPWPPTFASKSSRSERLTLLLQKIHTTHYNPPSAVRVTRICHQCTTPFKQTELVCLECNHELCHKCPKDQPHSSDTGNPHSPTPGGGGGTALAPKPRKENRPERMWKKPRMRVRYTCDQCETLFSEKGKTCEACGHHRCENCDRAPAIRILEGPVSATSPVVLKNLENRLATFAIIDSGVAARTLAAASVPVPSQFPPTPSHNLQSKTFSDLPSAPRKEPTSRLASPVEGEKTTLSHRLRTPEPAV